MLDVKGILGAAADVPSLLAKMITPPEPKALQQGTFHSIFGFTVCIPATELATQFFVLRHGGPSGCLAWTEAPLL